MEHPNLDILKSFNEASLPDLDKAVLGALELFTETPPPPFPAIPYARPLVVGSGNAALTGVILFKDTDAVFADESTYEARLAATPSIDGAILISASGGKHAVSIAKHLKEREIRTTLITNTSNAPARAYLDDDAVIVFPKNREPYTYNTSTYLGMILSKTKEDPAQIAAYLRDSVVPAIPEHLDKYDAFFVIIPEHLEAVAGMLSTKFDELFGPKVSGRIFTTEQARHAKTIVPSDTECFVTFGKPQELFGTPATRVTIPFPPRAGEASLLAAGYYLIGQIQKQHPPYFKDAIASYVKQASEMFGQTIGVIVE